MAVCYVQECDEQVPLKELGDNHHNENKRPPPSPRFRSKSLFDMCRDGERPQFQITEPDASQNINYMKYKSPIASMTFPKSVKHNDRKIKRLNTQLLEAIKQINIPEVRRLLDIGANPNAFCHLDCISACHLAALKGGESLSLLIKAGATTFTKDIIGQTPVHFAAWAGNAKQIALLLDFSEDLQNQVEYDISSEIEEAIRRFCVPINEMTNSRCDSEEIKTSLHKNWADNIDHNCCEESIPFFQPGWSPLHAASAHARTNCVRILLAAGADPNIRDYVGQTPLDVVGFAFYYKKDINEKHFTETIRILINAGSTQTCIRNRVTDSPLHTAVELGSLDSIQMLLDSGAEIVYLNRAGMTPLHVCVKKTLKEHLQLLVNYRNKDLDLNVASVDLRDKDGYTVLHSAVMVSWAPGVCVLLGAGANITAKGNNGETAIHSAASVGDLNILNEILSFIKHTDEIDQPNAKEETPLFKAIIHGHLECVQAILKNGASIKKTLPKNVNVLHIAAELGNYKILKVLLDHDYSVTRAMINFLTTDDQRGFGPIHFAVLNNHPDCVKLLISSNAYISLKSSCGPQKSMTPLHMAAAMNNIEIAKIIIKFNGTTIREVDAMGWSPLHTASNNGSRDVISLILSKGGDLSSSTTSSYKMSKTAISMIMNNLSKPTEFMEEIFDSYITSNRQKLQDPSSEITVNYEILMPNISQEEDEDNNNSNDDEKPEEDQNNNTNNNKQMKVIQAILETGNRYGQRRLLLHPLIESFLYLKWNALLPFSYIIMGLYALFVLSLTIFILSNFFYKDTSKPVPVGLEASHWRYVIYVCGISFITQELFLMNLSKNHFLELETWLKFSCIILAIVVPSAVGASNEDWPRHIATVTLLLAWLEMMFLSSRFPKWGYYVLMFGKVSSNIIKILLTFAFLLIGFSLSFMVQFHAQIPFEGPWAALVKTMVMMTSEFNYDDLLKPSNTSHVVIRLLFLVFLIFTAIVLMNLMVGVAVNDLSNLELIGNIRRLEKQVELLGSFENLVYNKLFKKIMPKRITSFWNENVIIRAITIKPKEPKSHYYKKVSSHIREAIFIKAQSHKKGMDAINDSQTLKMRLDSIHDLVFKCYEQKYMESRDLLNSQTDKLKNTNEDVSELRHQIMSCVQELKLPINELNDKMELILRRLDKLEDK